jgi:hypothetical protein
MGLTHFLESAGKAVGHVGDAVEFAANHPATVVKGAAKVGEYAIEHPGEVGKIAVNSLKSEVTNPVNLAINAALLVGTLGVGTAAKTAAKVGTETAIKTTAKVAGETGAKVAGETAAKVAGETAAKVGAETAGKVGAETAGKAASRVGSFLDSALKPGTIEKALNPLEMSKYGMTAQRAKLAGKIAPEGSGLARRAVGALVEGVGREAPQGANAIQKAAWRASRIERKVDQVQTADKVVNAAADPLGTAMKVSSGHTPVSQPGTEIEPYKQPGELQPLAQPVNSSYSPGRGFTMPASGGGGSTPPPTTPLGGSAYGGMGGSANNPSSSAPSTTASSPASPTQRSMSATDRARAWASSPRVMQDKGGLRAWQGPHREMFGGIDPGYDWRKGYENRPKKPFKPGVKGRKVPGGSTEEDVKQGTPGAYDTKSGQQPEGALNPGAPKMTTMGELGTGNQRQLGAGPPIHFGAPGPFKMAQPMAIGQGGRKASFYAASGEYSPQMPKNTSPGGNIIDADSMSPDDYKFEPGGQGYLDFPDMPRGPLSQPKRGRQVLGV